MRTVQILGQAPNVRLTPDLPGADRWLSNQRRGYKKGPGVVGGWTHWFNMHHYKLMMSWYPQEYAWYQRNDGRRPIVLQKADPSIPGSITFPRDEIISRFQTRFFTCTAAWQMAYALFLERYDRVQMCGFQLRRDRQYDWERPAFFYWVERLQKAGIRVELPVDLEITAAGNGDNYTGPLYGYETHTQFL